MNKSLKTVCYAATFIVFVMLAVFLHYKASYSFPTPWPDETTFIYPAISFQEANTLHAPQLNAERTIFWMPPGYMIVMGSIFKVTGFSFGLARAVSLVFFLLSSIFLFLIMREYGYPIISLLLCGLFMLNSVGVFIANTARMESLFLLIIFAGFFLIQSEKEYKGLSLIAISPLVHPNGFYFLLAACSYFFVNFLYRKRVFSKTDGIFLALSMVFWLSYVFYVGENWSVFLSDMVFQFGRKGSRDLIGTLITFLPVLLVIILAYIYALKNKLNSTLLFYLAVPAFIINRIGLEMFYQIFDFTFIFVFTLIIIDIVSHFLDYRFCTKRNAVKLGQIVICSVLFVFCYVVGVIDTPSSLKRFGMQIAKDSPYIKDSDIAVVKDFLLSKVETRGKPLIVQAYPRADGLFFHDLEKQGVLFSQPIFSRRKPDIYLMHVSRHLPQWVVKNEAGKEFEVFGINPSDARQILFQRDGTEIWYYNIL